MYWDCNVWAAGTPNFLGYYEEFSSPILFPLWFLRDLIVISIISPLIYLVLCKRKIAYIVLFIATSCYIFSISVNMPGFSTLAVAFFLLGASLSIHGRSIYETLSKRQVSIPSIVITVLTFIAALLLYEKGLLYEIILKLFCIFGSITLLNISILIAKNGSMLSSLSKYSHYTFFIFAFHAIVNRHINIIYSLLIPSKLEEQIHEIATTGIYGGAILEK